MILKKKQKTTLLRELNTNYNNRGDILNNSIKGIISEIERYAVKDGPGIRTVVSLKDVLSNASGVPIRKLKRILIN